MLYTQIIEKNIYTVKNEIRKQVKEVGFGILKEYEFQQILQTKGFPINQDITVFELCNPGAAQTALTSHPELSVYLPCRISVYEVDGNTAVSTIGLEDILNSFELKDEFKAHMSSIFDNIKKLIAKL